MNLHDLSTLMLEKLSESGLTVKDAHTLGFEPILKPPQSITIAAAGFILPYYDLNAKPIAFFRFRYLEPVRSYKGKLFRYTQPADASPEVYFSRLMDWNDYFERASNEAPIIITEGELKAACATKNGLPCLGLGGVWNFKTKRDTLIKSLRAIDWRERPTYIIYDSDAIANYQVLIAENVLAKELLSLGAHVNIVRLPHISEELKKTGLDDFIVHEKGGIDRLWALLEKTEPWETSKLLHGFNERFTFVHNPGYILEVGGKHQADQRMSKQEFETIFANHKYPVITQGKKGEKTEFRPLPKAWLEWPARGEVKRVTYLPGEGKITEAGEWNMWNGWGMNGTTIKKGNISLWRSLIDDVIFKSASSEDIHWFEQWLAYPIQHPGSKLLNAVVVWGITQGTGKSLIAYTMRRFYGSNFSEITDQMLQGNFNDWAEFKQFIMGDEIVGGDKRMSSDRMKGLITQNSLTINTKFMKPYTVPACANYYFTSNHPDSLFLEDSDRRYFVQEVHGEPKSELFYEEYDRWYKSDNVGALFWYLQHLDLTGFNPSGHARTTKSKSEMINLGRSEAGAWVAELKESPDNILKIGNANWSVSLATTKELYRLFDPAGTKRTRAEGLGRELKRAGFVQANFGNNVPTKTSGAQRLWVLRDNDKIVGAKKPAELAAIYDQERANGLPPRKY